MLTAMTSERRCGYVDGSFLPDSTRNAADIFVQWNQIKSFYSLIKYKYVLHMTVHELDKQGY